MDCYCLSVFQGHDVIPYKVLREDYVICTHRKATATQKWRVSRRAGIAVQEDDHVVSYSHHQDFKVVLQEIHHEATSSSSASRPSISESL